MGVAVVLSYNTWLARFPEFSNTVNDAAFGQLLGVASVLHRNDGKGPVSNAVVQSQLLGMAVAHIAFLQYGTNSQPASQVVGRINNASEGSVSVATDYGTEVSQSMAFWVQSKYGALYWQMTAVYRTMRYLPAPRREDNPFAWLYPNQGS